MKRADMVWAKRDFGRRLPAPRDKLPRRRIALSIVLSVAWMVFVLILVAYVERGLWW